MDVDLSEWLDLLKDVDTSIRQYLVSDLSQRPQVKTLLLKKDAIAVATNTGMTTGDYVRHICHNNILILISGIIIYEQDHHIIKLTNLIFVSMKCQISLLVVDMLLDLHPSQGDLMNPM
jgi:hypothetical protein